MKNGIFLVESFTEVINAINGLDVPVTTAYKIAKNVDAIMQAHKSFNELREKIAKKWCEKWEEDAPAKAEGVPGGGEPTYKKGDPKVEDGKYSFKGDNAEKFAKDFTELCNIDFKLPFKLTQKEMGDCKVKTQWLLFLEDMFSDLGLTKEEEKKEEPKAVANA